MAKVLGASAMWENFSWKVYTSPENFAPFVSNTTGTYFENLPNTYDARAWILGMFTAASANF